MHAGTVLHLTWDMRGKGSLLPVLTRRADLDLGTIFQRMQTDLREVQNLAGQFITHCYPLPGLTATAIAGNRKRHHLIRVLHHLQCLALVAGLSTWCPACFLTLTLWCPGFVLAGWLVGGAAVESEARLDFSKFSQHFGQLSFQLFAVRAGVVGDALLYSLAEAQTPR